jgi:hypothetical protein
MDLFSQSPYRKSVSTYLNELTRIKSEHARLNYLHRLKIA